MKKKNLVFIVILVSSYLFQIEAKPSTALKDTDELQKEMYFRVYKGEDYSLEVRSDGLYRGCPTNAPCISIPAKHYVCGNGSYDQVWNYRGFTYTMQADREAESMNVSSAKNFKLTIVNSLDEVILETWLVSDPIVFDKDRKQSCQY
jgi:hypothetical protein